MTEMKMLIAEDDDVARKVLRQLVKGYGSIDMVENGLKAVLAFSNALKDNEPYDVVWMDIMMPELDGQEAMMAMRLEEKKFRHERKAHFIVSTALKPSREILKELKGLHDGYIVKPFKRQQIENVMIRLGLIEGEIVDVPGIEEFDIR
jgi:two-component system, chemotaxis family, chemotaxis protein CheY